MIKDSLYPNINIEVLASEEAFEMAIAAARRVGFTVRMIEQGRTAYTFLPDLDGIEAGPGGRASRPHGGMYIKKSKNAQI